MRALAALWFDESGAALVEYAIITASLSVACILGFYALVTAVNNEFGTIASGFQSFETGTPP